MSIKLFVTLGLSWGLALFLIGCGKPQSDPPVVGAPPIITTNASVTPTFESSLAMAQLLFDQGKFSEARDAARSCKPTGIFEARKIGRLKAEIAKALHASKLEGGQPQHP